MKVLGAVALHYGKEWLEYTLESIQDAVEEILIVYTERPSYGHIGNRNNPDSQAELKDIANKFSKVTWLNITSVFAENTHRQVYQRYGVNNNYDQILIADSDEVFVDPHLMLAEAEKHHSFNIGVGGNCWFTPWRNFNEYLQDGFYPIRILNLKEPMLKHSGPNIIETGQIWHMGYCISQALMEYKWSCHGHQMEINQNFTELYKNYNKEEWDAWIENGWRKDEDYVLHPVSKQTWTQTKELTRDMIPEILRKHELYRNK